MLGRSVRNLARPQNTAKSWNSWTRDLDNKDTLVFTDGLPDWTGFTTHNATNSTPLVTYICTLNHHRCYLCQPLELCIGMIQLRIFQAHMRRTFRQEIRKRLISATREDTERIKIFYDQHPHLDPRHGQMPQMKSKRDGLRKLIKTVKDFTLVVTLAIGTGFPGAYIGQSLCPIPIVGWYIGGAVGGIVGGYAGYITGSSAFDELFDAMMDI